MNTINLIFFHTSHAELHLIELNKNYNGISHCALVTRERCFKFTENPLKI